MGRVALHSYVATAIARHWTPAMTVNRRVGEVWGVAHYVYSPSENNYAI